jgi:hypothetical protein
MKIRASRRGRGGRRGKEEKNFLKKQILNLYGTDADEVQILGDQSACPNGC